MEAKDSAIAKSTGDQDHQDFNSKDLAMFEVLKNRRKLPKSEAGYVVLDRNSNKDPKPLAVRKSSSDNFVADNTNTDNDSNSNKNEIYDIKPELDSCLKCKFNLGDERKCHIVEGDIDNERGISNFFSPKGDGMLPGDIVWEFIKKTGSKLEYNEGYVIDEGAEGFQCKDCKFYLYSSDCLLVRGKFRPKMSCGFVVRVGNGTEL